MRVGRIVQVDDFPEARKPAYKLTIDFGVLGAEPGQQVADSLRRLKSLMETGSATPIKAISSQDALLDAELSG
jgi:uncharacterized membrane protein